MRQGRHSKVLCGWSHFSVGMHNGRRVRYYPLGDNFLSGGNPASLDDAGSCIRKPGIDDSDRVARASERRRIGHLSVAP